jgi:hypothetical protein
MKFRPRTYATITAIVAAFSMVVFFYTPAVAAEPPYFVSPTQISQGDPQQWTDMEENITFANDTQAILWTSKDPDAVDDGLGWNSRKGIAHSYVSYREVGQQDWSAETETIWCSNPGFIGMLSWVYPVQYIAANGVYEIKLISEDADGFRCEEVYTIEVDTDSDQDGYADEVDNCPATPNGHLAGTCYNYYTQESWGSCMTNADCEDGSKWYVWCDTFQVDLDENGIGDVCEGPQDSDQDGYDDDEDNCPGTPNPGQQDADGDGIGDACDADTLYGYISGEFKEGIKVNIAIETGSGEEIVDTLITDEDGYYAIGDLEDKWYEVTPEDYDYIFTPNSASVQISTGL